MNLRKMRTEELPALLGYYPWFALARKEICSRIMQTDKEALTAQECSDAALYAPSRRAVFSLLAGNVRTEKTKSPPASPCVPETPVVMDNDAGADFYRGMGDYFSTVIYERERLPEDGTVSELVRRIDPDATPRDVTSAEFTDFCTEPLAQVYLEQGYMEQARDIYSKLSLRYPEKSAYFAALIDKIDKEI